jgi:parvulin-like peptidyl-prolyl isomerase
MKRSQILLGTAALASTIVACDGLKEAFTAHVDVVAKAEGQELSTERLATLLGNSQIPVRKDVAGTVADFWVSYQLLGYAGAHGDTLADSATKNWWVTDTKAIDEAMWSMILGARTRVFFDTVASKFPLPDTTGLDQKYTQSTSLAAQHILVMLPEGGSGLSQAKQDSVRRRAEDIRRRVTSANFNSFVAQYSDDPGSKQNNGTYAMFPPGQMVPEFENAVRSVPPGEIVPGVVKTNFGYHIIRRHTLDEVRPQFVDALVRANMGTAQQEYVTKLRADWKVEVKPEAAAKVKEVATSPTDARGDRTVLATSRLGNFTAGRLVDWIEVIPPQLQIRERFLQSPDSMVVNLLKSIVDQEILNAQAEKEGIKPDTLEIAQIRNGFTAMVNYALTGLRVDPKSLRDSASTTSEKERLAAARVDAALDQLFATNGQSMVEVPPPLAYALRQRYSSRVNAAGLDRAVEQGLAIRAAADSARMKLAPAVPPAGAGGRGDTTGTSR